jgi:2-methylcitrate dehydratase
MAILAAAYQVQCRLSDDAPARSRGFDRTVQDAYGAMAGIGRILGLHQRSFAKAIAIKRL